MTTAQAVTPGQGQTVDIAGVQVGEITSVQARRTARRSSAWTSSASTRRSTRTRACCCGPRPASRTWSPSSRPGTPSAGKLPEGGTIPISQTLPDVNLDEVLASLDADTRDYLRLLLSDGGEALKGNGSQLGQTLRRVEPTAKYSREVNEALAKRRANIARVVHNFSLLTDELGRRDDAARGLRRELERGLRRARAPGREPRADAAPAALRRSTSRRPTWPRSSGWPRRSARRCSTCGPAPGRSARRCARCARS